MSNQEFLKASETGDLETVQRLLESNEIDINIKNIFNHLIFIKFKPNFFYGIENMNDLWNLTRTFNRTALILAAMKDHKEIVELLLRQEGIGINSQDILNQKNPFIIFKSNFLNAI